MFLELVGEAIVDFEKPIENLEVLVLFIKVLFKSSLKLFLKESLL